MIKIFKLNDFKNVISSEELDDDEVLTDEAKELLHAVQKKEKGQHFTTQAGYDNAALQVDDVPGMSKSGASSIRSSDSSLVRKVR